VAPDEALRLSQLSHGAGCACKIGAAELQPVLAELPLDGDPKLLVGAATRDDAAVYRLSDEVAIVQSADFFTPIVDDPYDFGRIAAANALSDIYAMGADPVFCLNLVAYPLERLGSEALREILRGGAAIAAEADAVIAGGHSIDDPEPKYGMAVTGVVRPDRVITNAGGRPGDRLFLTKPLGGGLITTAAKRALGSAELIARATATMVELNRESAAAASATGATAMTDVTGFGLLGHLHELAEASGCAARVEAAAVPAIDGALDLAADERCVAGGSRRNAAYAESFTAFAATIGPERRVLLSDAMTSGGLLVAVPRPSAGGAPGVEIGELVDGRAGEIAVA
jgi:selenide, water dikinase